MIYIVYFTHKQAFLSKFVFLMYLSVFSVIILLFHTMTHISQYAIFFRMNFSEFLKIFSEL